MKIEITPGGRHITIKADLPFSGGLEGNMFLLFEIGGVARKLGYKLNAVADDDKEITVTGYKVSA